MIASRRKPDVMILLFLFAIYFLHLLCLELKSGRPFKDFCFSPRSSSWIQTTRAVAMKSSVCRRNHMLLFYCCVSTLGAGWSQNTPDPYPVITCLSHCSERVEVSFLLLLLHTLGHYHKYGTLTLVPCLSGYKLSLQVSHRGLPLILIKAW